MYHSMKRDGTFNELYEYLFEYYKANIYEDKNLTTEAGISFAMYTPICGKLFSFGEGFLRNQNLIILLKPSFQSNSHLLQL